MYKIKRSFNNLKKWLKEDKRVFAKDLCGYKLFWIFMLGSFFGVMYEQILNFITHYFKYGIIFWEMRRGVIYGPFNPLYGAGAVLMIWLLLRKKRNNMETFLIGGIIGGTFEYVISLLQETFVGTVSWDYSKKFLNIGGRTTIPFMVVWGILALLLAKVVYPKISSIIEKIPYRLGEIVTKWVIIFMCFNMLISWGALIRQTIRRQGIPPITKVDKLFDEYYPDEFLKKYYPNMKVRN